MMERSADMVVALLGILKAGAAYLPLDPSHPAGRLQTILHHARPSVLITQSSLRDSFAVDTTLPVLSMDSDWPALAANYSSANCSVVAHPDNLAYLMYTSGSTGEPKGIAVSQRSIVRLVKETNYASFSAAEVFLYLAPLSFDASTFEIWGPLLNGARLVVMPPGPLSLAALGDLIVREEVTTLWLTASLFELMVDEELDDLRGVRQLLAGGDVLSPSHVTRALSGLPETTIINGYGPTENTTFTCTYKMTQADQIGGSVPIGVPINNTRVYVLDGEMKPVPVGVPGQLYTGGDGLARGYFEQAGMTAERFVPDPLSGEPGARLYQTGDVVKYRNDGLLEFIERRDQQVKVRGFRIELGEIEAVLSSHKQVRQSVVVARIPAEESGLASEEKRLVAYVVAEDEAVVSTAELRSYLKQQLPEYMVPAAFLLMKTIPVTANGKVDRRALPEPEWGDNATTSRAAATPVEELLVGIWADVLGIEAGLGASDNFFEIGGHSLLATQVVSRVRQVFKREMPVRVVFECPTVEEQGAWLEEEMRAGGAREEQLPMERVNRDQPLALSFAQQRLWFLDQLSPGNTAYNISFDMVFEGPLNFAALEASVNEMVRRHEVLRTTFAVVNDQPVQVISAIGSLTLPIIDLERSVAGEREAEVEQMARNEREIPFDLTVGPLLRVKLLRFGAEEHVLLFTMHHIITDAWSEGIFFDELRTLYHAFSVGEPAPLPELEIQYADFSAWQRKWLQGSVLEAQLTYWKKQLAGAPAMLELPTDKPRPSVQTYQGARQSYLLNSDVTEGLRTLCQREGTTLFMTLLAAFQTLLSRYTGQEDIVIGSPVAGRNRAEVEGLIGFFINTLVLRGDLHGDPTFKELLRRLREVTLEAYGQQDLPFEKLIEELNLGRDMSRSPLFQVFFNLLNASSESHQTLSTAVQRHVPPPVAKPTVESTKFDLTLYAVNQNEHIRLDLVYNTDLFEAATITRMFGHFQTLLEGILTNPEQRLSTLPIISEAERQELLGRRNLVRPETDFVEFEGPDGEQTIVSRFAEQVQLHPENIAVKTDLYEWSYQTLEAMSTQVSRQIVGLPERICLLFEHDAPMILGLLATLKAGKTYVPLDPQYPQERLSFILKDAQAGAILTNTKNLIAAQKLANGTVPVINIDTLNAEAAGEDIAPEIAAGTMAYILYTSGSAGRPKGVMQSHRNVLRHIASYTNNLHLNAGDRLTLLSSYSFDAAVMDIYGALLNGATLCPFNIKDEGLNEFAPWLIRHEITVYHSTPTVYRYFVDTLGVDEDFPLIRLVVLGGEEVFKRDVEHYRRHFSSKCIFVNGLGPTESTVTLQYMINKDSPLSDHRVPVGYPVEDTEVLLLNAHRERVAAYGIGEIAIKSDHVALGYWQQPVLTQQAFSQNAEDGDNRIYYTGDLGRLLSDGSIEFLGRKDFQVKIRGYKIDFSEIETGILKNPAIREVIVSASDDQGELRLAAYLVCDPRQPFDLEALRRSLGEQLPDYMIPAAFVILDALPLTPTGKLDRRALPAPDWTGSSSLAGVGAPRTPIEEVIAGIWSEVLGIEVHQLGVHDNFFQRGGHSLLATLVISRVRDVFHTKFPLRMMFHTPTIAGLADAILEKLVEQEDGEHIEKLLTEIEQLAPAPA
jgi:amino acid adenylation domain-containing protein